MRRNFLARVVHPRKNSGYSARDVAKAYGCPVDLATGHGVTVGIIELGGAYNIADMAQAKLGATVTVVNVAGGKPKSDGPNGADGEVMLDVEVVAQVAPDANIRVYFAPNTDAGFEQAVQLAAGECDVVSISWGGPESSWSSSSVKKFSAIFAQAKANGVITFCAAGDAGSKDGTSSNTADYPASDPSVVGCGGTRLTLDANGHRKAEVVWNDNPSNDATGGGVSRFFPGRTVPDVAGNADPVTGYTVVVDGQTAVIGGTSAVAPLYAGMCAVVQQLIGRRIGDFNAVVAANPTICFDVTQGNNGGYKAGPGRDSVSGWGVVDMAALATVLGAPQPVPTPPTPPAPGKDAEGLLRQIQGQINAYFGNPTVHVQIDDAALRRLAQRAAEKVVAEYNDKLTQTLREQP